MLEEMNLLDDEDIVTVRNRSNALVGYEIPELRINRNFTKNEVKKIKMGELRQLSYISGGQAILNNYLVIENSTAVEELIPNAEPEYHYTEADVRKILLTGSIDELLDTFDFGPEGIKDIIKDIAVKEQLNDVKKREIIKEKTGFDVTKAIYINELDKQDDGDNAASEGKQRRVKPAAEADASKKTVRRVVKTQN